MSEPDCGYLLLEVLSCSIVREYENQETVKTADKQQSTGVPSRPHSGTTGSGEFLLTAMSREVKLTLDSTANLSERELGFN